MTGETGTTSGVASIQSLKTTTTELVATPSTQTIPVDIVTSAIPNALSGIFT